MPRESTEVAEQIYKTVPRAWKGEFKKLIAILEKRHPNDKQSWDDLGNLCNYTLGTGIKRNDSAWKFKMVSILTTKTTDEIMSGLEEIDIK